MLIRTWAALLGLVPIDATGLAQRLLGPFVLNPLPAAATILPIACGIGLFLYRERRMTRRLSESLIR